MHDRMRNVMWGICCCFCDTDKCLPIHQHEQMSHFTLHSSPCIQQSEYTRIQYLHETRKFVMYKLHYNFHCTQLISRYIFESFYCNFIIYF